jgi:hypothetical protein
VPTLSSAEVSPAGFTYVGRRCRSAVLPYGPHPRSSGPMLCQVLVSVPGHPRQSHAGLLLGAILTDQDTDRLIDDLRLLRILERSARSLQHVGAHEDAAAASANATIRLTDRGLKASSDLLRVTGVAGGPHQGGR